MPRTLECKYGHDVHFANSFCDSCGVRWDRTNKTGKQLANHGTAAPTEAAAPGFPTAIRKLVTWCAIRSLVAAGFLSNPEGAHLKMVWSAASAILQTQIAYWTGLLAPGGGHEWPQSAFPAHAGFGVPSLQVARGHRATQKHGGKCFGHGFRVLVPRMTSESLVQRRK